MNLYFLRHGDAGDAREWKGDDSARPLSAQGSEQVTRAASRIAALDLDLDLIISSPLLRAKQTAEIVAAALKPSVTLAVVEQLAPGFGPRELSRVLRENADKKAVMLVGHEPDFSHCIEACIGGGRVKLGKGALARIETSSPGKMHGSLTWLIPARALAP